MCTHIGDAVRCIFPRQFFRNRAGFLAEVCGVRRNRVSVAAGSRSRCKLVTVEGAGSAADVATKLEAALELS